MSHPLPVRQDIDFLLHDWLKLGRILQQPRFAEIDVATVDAYVDLSETLAADAFLSHYKSADVDEPCLDGDQVRLHPPIKQALAQYAQLGLFAAGFEEDLGGMGLPYLACSAGFAYFAAANVATSAYPMLTTANARLIATFGSPAQVATFARPQIEGRWFGTMCLSEPQAGSYLADVRTTAVADGQDDLGARYRLTGNKMWISGGDQDASENIVHLVLAKTPDETGRLPAGTRGLSLFIAPKFLPDGTRNDISVAGLNHKMGYRGTANCLLNFGEKGGATAWRVGEDGHGLRQMFLMMNEARIGVGIGAAALAYRGYRHALAYARERVQGVDADGQPAPIIAHADVRRMLLAQKAYAEGALALCFYCASLVDQPQNDEAQALLALLTPVAKTWPSEYGLLANDLAIQVHGGYGYTRDFDVEQLYRDNRLNPIHEGTTGIQGIDLLGRKLAADAPGWSVLRRRIAETVERANGDPTLARPAQALAQAWTSIADALEYTRGLPSAHRLNNATAFLRAFGHGVVAWLWLDQALAAQTSGRSREFIAGKRITCLHVFEYEVPLIDGWLQPVINDADTAVAIPDGAF